MKQTVSGIVLAVLFILTAITSAAMLTTGNSLLAIAYWLVYSSVVAITLHGKN